MNKVVQSTTDKRMMTAQVDADAPRSSVISTLSGKIASSVSWNIAGGTFRKYSSWIRGPSAISVSVVAKIYTIMRSTNTTMNTVRQTMVKP